MIALTIVGARPQFVKAAAVSRVLRPSHREILLHTGQHYDENMSQVFFRELGLPTPDVRLDVGSGSHAAQTAHMLIGIEAAITRERPDVVIVYGDTNSTLAGALAAAKLSVPVAHVEAGLRSFNRTMPEEVNRVATDHLSAMLFCPSEIAARNVRAEGITDGVHVVGDVMAEVLVGAAAVARERSDVLERLRLAERGYLVATVHRAGITADPRKLRDLLRALETVGEDIVFPVHPRTRKTIASIGWTPAASVRLIEPLGYIDMVRLAGSARMILTDSGGLQKEAYWLGVPCVTLRDETEWVETVEAGWNVLAGTEPDRIVELVRSFVPPDRRPVLYGDGHASARIVSALESSFAETPELVAR